MNYLFNYVKQRLSNFNRDEYIILFVVASIFLPFYVSMITIIGVLLYLIIKRRLFTIVQSVSKSWYAIGFCLLTSIVAGCYGNWLGLACGIGILCMFLFMFYFRTIIHKRLLELILDVCCILSVFCAVWSIVEYIEICQRLNYSLFEFKVANAPGNRINATFFNANYYAMMLEFFILICVYKVICIKDFKHALFYVGIALMNMIILYLTGCRTAWVPFLISVPFMFIINKRYGYLTLTCSGIGAGIVLLLLKPSLFQRMTLAKDFAKRSRIWSTAIQGIQAHPLLGEGPLTYYQIYPLYDGHPTQHAHNVFLDPILSHGIIGVIIIAVYFASNLKQAIMLFTKRVDVALFSLIVAFIITVILHGMLDYTVYWVQTGFLFLIVLSSSSIYVNQSRTS